MADLRDTVQDNLSWTEWFASKIPGYSGYKEKEMRREADMLLRDHLVQQFSQTLGQAEDVTSQMLTGPGIAHLDEIDKGNTRLQTLIDKIKTAAQGYAGFFDAVKVKEEELDALYEFDRDMLVKADEISAALDQVQAALDSGDSSKLAPAVRRYVRTVTDASDLFDRRREVITGLM